MSALTIGTRVVSAVGASRLAGEELECVGATRVAVVADAGVLGAGLLDPILGTLRGGHHVVGDGVRHPDVATVENLAGTFLAAGCDAVLAVGGGAALGVGKAVALRLTNTEPIDAYEGSDRAPNRPAPSVAVPTTAGSGSEVSRALVLHEEGRVRNLVVQGAGYEPDVAILDGALLTAVPHEPALYAGLDALSHALEALWTRGRSYLTDTFAVAAADRIRTRLPQALNDGTAAGWQEMLEASALANLACGNTGLGLVHALSSPPSAVPHGRLNGILMPHVGAFNRDRMSDDGRRQVDGLSVLYDQVGMVARFQARDLGDPGLPDRMVRAAMTHAGRGNNVRPADESDLRAIVTAARAGSTPLLRSAP